MIGCDQNVGNTTEDSIPSLQAQIAELQVQIDALQEDYNLFIAQYADMLAVIWEMWEADNEPTSEPLILNQTYTGQLNLDTTYSRLFEFTVTQTQTLYFTVIVDTELDLNFRTSTGALIDWLEFHESGTQFYTFEPGTYKFELQNWYDYDEVKYSFSVSESSV